MCSGSWGDGRGGRRVGVLVGVGALGVWHGCGRGERHAGVKTGVVEVRA